MVVPEYDNATVFECKYELDSLAAFLEVSYDYFNATQDIEFFGKYSWVSAVESVLKVAENMMVPTYGEDGMKTNLSYTFTRDTTSSTETQSNSKKHLECSPSILNTDTYRRLRQSVQPHWTGSKLLQTIG